MLNIRYRPIAFFLSVALAGAPLVACASTQEPPSAPKVVTPRDLSQTPERFAGVEVKVTGRLTSEGNYFSRNRKIVLLGENGDRIEVTPWLPLSAPPPRSDSAKEPATLADYLDRKVELIGVLRREPAKAPGTPTASEARLEVKSAKILSQ